MKSKSYHPDCIECRARTRILWCGQKILQEWKTSRNIRPTCFYWSCWSTPSKQLRNNWEESTKGQGICRSIRNSQLQNQQFECRRLAHRQYHRKRLCRTPTKIIQVHCAKKEHSLSEDNFYSSRTLWWLNSEDHFLLCILNKGQRVRIAIRRFTWY